MEADFDTAVKEASRRAAKVFQDNEWKWTIGAVEVVPSVEQIEETYRVLHYSMQKTTGKPFETDCATTGRLLVMRVGGMLGVIFAIEMEIHIPAKRKTIPS